MGRRLAPPLLSPRLVAADKITSFFEPRPTELTKMRFSVNQAR